VPSIKTESGLELIPTPFGWRPKQCVHRNVGNGVTIRPVREKSGAEVAVEVVHENGTVFALKPYLPECIEWDQKMQQQRRKAGKVGAPLDGWLDYAGYYPPDLVSRFDGNYTVPPSPQLDSSQVLFYFIGTENFKGGSGVTILQPVLTWGNGINGWSYASWNCCPGGQQHESTPLTGFGPGNVLYAGIDQSGGTSGDWTIISRFGTRSTTLKVTDAGRDFDWIDATLETYGVTSCNEFPVGPMAFTNTMVRLAGGRTNTPVWTADTGATQCQGKLNIISPAAITISHNM
jgi:hypothetical protein